MTMTPLSESLSRLNGITLVASDMDGTMTTNGRFSPDVFHAFEKLEKAGIRIVLITGRSAGWVNGLVSLLPIHGAIAENGGLYFPAQGESGGTEIVSLRGSRQEHKQALRAMFHTLQKEFPRLEEAPDNTFRITDWTFSVKGLSENELMRMNKLCELHSWSFTYSNVQCHIMLPEQNKSAGLKKVLSQEPNLRASLQEVLTIGDSPNDETLFNTAEFPNSVGVANVKNYARILKHLPAFVTTHAESAGFCEMASLLVQSKLR
jgi:HAD superfamily hydrolase (TIGR01484 family)